MVVPKSKYLIAIILLILISCNDNLEKKIYEYSYGSEIKYYKDGIIVRRETFSSAGLPVGIMEYENGHIKNVKVYNGANLASEYSVKENNVSLLKIHYPNGRITYGEGKLDNEGREVGWWAFYDENRKLLTKEYMVIVDGQQVIGQDIVYKNGKI